MPVTPLQFNLIYPQSNSGGNKMSWIEPVTYETAPVQSKNIWIKTVVRI